MTDQFICPPDHQHDQSRNCYNHHRCRCMPCTDLNRRATNERRKLIAFGRWDRAMTSSAGTHRRLQALVAQGWALSELSRRLGYTRGALQELFASDQTMPEARRTVAALYDELWDKQPPSSTARQRQVVSRSKNLAKRKGWAGPLAWDDDTIDDPSATPAVADEIHGVDDIAVQLSIDGARPFLTQEERRLVVSHLHRMRWSDPRIASHIGHVASKTIARDRKALGLEAWPTNELAADERGAA